jgi:hypothetical protein
MMLVQVYGYNAMKKAAVGDTFFWGKRKCDWWREIRMTSNKNWKKHCKSLSNCAWKSSAVRSIAQHANIDREIVRKILTEDLHMKKVCAKMVPKDLLTRHCLWESF